MKRLPRLWCNIMSVETVSLWISAQIEVAKGNPRRVPDQMSHCFFKSVCSELLLVVKALRRSPVVCRIAVISIRGNSGCGTQLEIVIWTSTRITNLLSSHGYLRVRVSHYQVENNLTLLKFYYNDSFDQKKGDMYWPINQALNTVKTGWMPLVSSVQNQLFYHPLPRMC